MEEYFIFECPECGHNSCGSWEQSDNVPLYHCHRCLFRFDATSLYRYLHFIQLWKYCGNCEYLKPNEKRQSNEKESHICTKYKKVVSHAGHHPNLVKLKECVEETRQIAEFAFRCSNNKEKRNEEKSS